ncbi:MAG: hypothetical protein NVSMB29_15230 [Candidatus Dormibacteria bacterium]
MSVPAPPEVALHATWARLHPLSPLVRFGRASGALLFLMLTNLSTGLGGGGRRGGLPWLTLALAAIGLLGGVVAWWVTSWRLDGGDLQIRSGLIRRQSLRLPLARIQAVDLVSPLLGRVLGLAEVRVVVAGRGSERGRLGYLPESEARSLRAQLLALAHGLAADTPEPQGRPVVTVSNPRLVAAVLLSPSALGALALAMVAIGASALPPHRLGAAGGALTPVLALGMEAARRLNTDFNFVIAEAPDGLRLRRGALQVRTETIPAGRIQAVRWVEPLLWRPFGWCRLEVDVARQAASRRSDEGSRQLSRLLLPVGTREEAAWLLSRALPGAGAGLGAGTSPPRRALLRAPLAYHYLRVWLDERHLAARTGRLRPATVIIPLEKIQSLRLRSGPWQRRLRLASLHVDSAGRRWQAAASCRDADEAAALLDRLSGLAGSARRERP